MSANETYTPGYSANAAAFMALRGAVSHAAFFVPYLRPGLHVLDCGCGPGTITVGLARMVAPGQVVGIDRAASQIELARAHAAEQQLGTIEFRQGSVYTLPFADQTFDAVFSHALLEHLAEPVAALAEMKRVLKPGGVAGVCSPDWRGFLVAPSTLALVEAIEFYKRIQLENGGDVNAGGKLGIWMEAAGFRDVRMDARYECYKELPLIGEYLAQRIELAAETDGAIEKGWTDAAGLVRMASALRGWQVKPSGLFAQAWVSAVGFSH